MTDEAWRVKADYYDVWSGMFGETFFGVQADWAAENNVEYLVHLNHEEQGLRLDLPEDLTRNEGDFFRDMRHVQVPGIDNLTQLIPSLVHTPDGTWNVNNNFPKLASSAAHLFGRPKVWTEDGGGPGIDGKYPVGLSTGPRSQRHADPGSGDARRRGRSGGSAARSPAAGLHAGMVYRTAPAI